MVVFIITIYIGIITVISFFGFCKYIRPKIPEAFIKINIIDFNKNNYFNTISLSFKENTTFKKVKIVEKSLIINVFGFSNKLILKGELSIINSNNKDKKIFKIKVYKNCTNIINIRINNENNIYYNSEIIFYKKSSEENIKLESGDFESSTHNCNNRKRLLLYNINEEELIKIIKDNINDKELENKAANIIKNNNNKLLLINIYKSTKKNNILIFEENEKKLIIPSKEEKKFFENYFWLMNAYRFDLKAMNKFAEEYKNKIEQNKKIFGQGISNLDNEKDINTYFSFINQGINCIYDENIISKNNLKDYYFVLGYMLLYGFFFKKNKFYYDFINLFFLKMEIAYKKNYSLIDLMKIAISFIVFSTNNKDIIYLQFSDELEEDSPYKKGFEFFKQIILDLNEDSDLTFMYLQINSGCGLELITEKKCYKLSMISVEDIKSHIISTIPKYFYIFNSNNDEYIGTDARTQIMIFNEKKILDKNSTNKKNNSTMNITIGMFHESGHAKFHMNIDVGGDRSPVRCVNKNFDFTEKFNWYSKERGESGKFIDHFLYDSNIDTTSIDLINSLRSNELMNKTYFIGNLNQLNQKANEIIGNKIAQNEQNNNINNKGNSEGDISTLSAKYVFRGNLDDEEYARLQTIGGDIYY